MKHWHRLHINPNLAEIFQNLPILVFRRSKNLRDIMTHVAAATSSRSDMKFFLLFQDLY